MPYGNWNGLVVYCAGVSWDSPVQGTNKHIATRLAKYAPVLWVDPPISRLTPRRKPYLARSVEPPRLRLLRTDMARLTPLAPPLFDRFGVRAVTNQLVRRSIATAVRSLDASVAAIVVASPEPRFNATREGRRIYFATDDFVAGAALMGRSERRLRRVERLQLQHADVVVAVSTSLAERWEAIGYRVIRIPNGCDHRHYMRTDDAPLPDDVNLTAPVVGLVGQLSGRIDVRLLEAVVAEGCSLLLVGPRQPAFEPERMKRLLSHPNVQWVGRKPFEALPSYLRVIDVGITPYTDTPFNRGSFPLKTLEYLAAGRAVVSTDLPSVRWLATDLIVTASTAAEFAASVRTALAEPRSAALVERRRTFAAQHSWDRRADDLARAAGLVSSPNCAITPASSPRARRRPRGSHA